ncbi:putative photosynthetic complex assembly protein PuhE [Methylocapsa palsarum]|uniref:Putative photosynthetic complex assembly protein 2 n=1 Tax=Methylocapsa palsarum TaxID=1612308 RepID=A0A1I4BEU9_9HYPH|nr:putative photosynthetic complex assembly protein PuhE [Methylocapsa palsarum]SFK66526.1 putative photosynthetic complex assembly protein 2 [Methylocapsa palsarum]
MLLLYGPPIGYALFLWWFSTGVIIVLDGLPRRTYSWTMGGATLVMLGSLYGLFMSSTDTSVTGAYIAFTCALLVWGWNEISFLMGFISGPRRAPCPAGASGWRRFRYAAQTLLYHELVIASIAALIIAITANGANQFGTWTFIILWFMRLSAKLNVFFGVPNLTEELLPDHMKYLESYFRRRPMNLFFPVSISVSMVIVVGIVRSAAASASLFQASGHAFLATLMFLAILEHWFLVLPLSSIRLWSWSLRTDRSGRRVKAISANEKIPGGLPADIMDANAST